MSAVNSWCGRVRSMQGRDRRDFCEAFTPQSNEVTVTQVRGRSSLRDHYHGHEIMLAQMISWFVEYGLISDIHHCSDNNDAFFISM